MIDFRNNTLKVPGSDSEPIEEWKVVFATAEGCFETLDEAKESCVRTLQDVRTIMPLPAAFGPKGYEVSLKQTMLIPDSE